VAYHEGGIPPFAVQKWKNLDVIQPFMQHLVQTFLAFGTHPSTFSRVGILTSVSVFFLPLLFHQLGLGIGQSESAKKLLP
jgi:hypothetical protein